MNINGVVKEQCFESKTLLLCGEGFKTGPIIREYLPTQNIALENINGTSKSPIVL